MIIQTTPNHESAFWHARQETNVVILSIVTIVIKNFEQEMAIWIEQNEEL